MDSLFRQSPIDVVAYEPPLSLWSLVENYVAASEREEIRDMLGASLVQQSVELHDEINMLLDIWRDYRCETDELCKKQTTLPEPPAIRDRLKQEIKFFVETIREKNGRDAGHILAKHNSKVLEYVMANKRSGSVCSSRPSTARSSRDGRETPLISPRSDQMSVSSSVSEEVESMNEKLNILKFDEVVQHLRETLEQEVDTLLSDISYLQNCIDGEVDFRCESRFQGEEPSLTDLRSERSQLEKDLIQTISDPGMPDVADLKTKAKTQNAQIAPGVQKKPVRTETSIKQRPLSASSSGPLKASHSISPQMLEAAQAAAGSLASCSPTSRRTSRSPGVQLDMGVSHLTVRTSSLPRSARLVKVASMPSPTLPSQNGDVFPPSPPGSAKPSSGRPGSASRFRKMVLECRET